MIAEVVPDFRAGSTLAMKEQTPVDINVNKISMVPDTVHGIEHSVAAHLFHIGRHYYTHCTLSVSLDQPNTTINLFSFPTAAFPGMT
jgi:hypothetical protein